MSLADTKVFVNARYDANARAAGVQHDAPYCDDACASYREGEIGMIEDAMGSAMAYAWTPCECGCHAEPAETR